MPVNKLSLEKLLTEQVRYLAEVDSEDPDKRRVAGERLQEITAELARREAHQPRWTTANNGWPQVDLVALIQQSGCSVPMNDILTQTLKSVKLQRVEGVQVFCNRGGSPYRSFRTAFERAVRQAGIADFTFHDLRHTFASRLVMAGVDLPTVKELLGHKDISMTMRDVHLSSDHKQAAVRKLESFGEKVPAIFTTPPAGQRRTHAQAIEMNRAPVAQPG